MNDDKYLKHAELTIDAPPAEIFALLSDPDRHPEIDGSGTVRGVQASTAPLRAGSVFDMHMKHGYSYSTRNTVVELQPDRVIAWQTRPLTRPLSWLIGGRIWRYELTPDGSGTRVMGTWDLRPERKRALVRPLAGDPGADMLETLRRIGRIVTGGRES
ncbi:SRPBCC family protein [uncultured Jatrophihabitans sp.]|uniref:SRPBCC family protein n=1 Tax=uncultured Jatrophihabitans sp. TaxID=1610747 RepID=UPI0035CC65AD